jgi:hypothetical protein
MFPPMLEPALASGGQVVELRFFLERRSHDLGGRVSGEQLFSAQHLKQHHAERPDVGAAIHRLALGLLRRHVGRGAQDHSHLRRAHGKRGRHGGAAGGGAGSFFLFARISGKPRV